MADRHSTHNGRDSSGNFRVRQADVDDLLEEPKGSDIVRDDIRLGGAVADTGPHAGELAKHIGDMIDENREDVGKATGRSSTKRGKKGGR